MNAHEIEIYFPHKDTYIEAVIHDYTSTFKFICSWQHWKYSENLDRADLPSDENELKEMAIKKYQRHQLENMEITDNNVF